MKWGQYRLFQEIEGLFLVKDKKEILLLFCWSSTSQFL
ncbi:hypothetical protein JCM19235_4142 [Vibrio maritimus]|uniref:Uncharacterized protein n=1 Tax=Vibrio maritimus TaxID=990268 RepID=A0A090SKK2_9VIBR|nr:hypothetical protein JCM19235_4142 [Vibrio maritimus]